MLHNMLHDTVISAVQIKLSTGTINASPVLSVIVTCTSPMITSRKVNFTFLSVICSADAPRLSQDQNSHVKVVWCTTSCYWCQLSSSKHLQHFKEESGAFIWMLQPHQRLFCFSHFCDVKTLDPLHLQGKLFGRKTGKAETDAHLKANILCTLIFSHKPRFVI